MDERDFRCHVDFVSIPSDVLVGRQMPMIMAAAGSEPRRSLARGGEEVGLLDRRCNRLLCSPTAPDNTGNT